MKICRILAQYVSKNDRCVPECFALWNPLLGSYQFEATHVDRVKHLVYPRLIGRITNPWILGSDSNNGWMVSMSLGPVVERISL